MPVLTVYRHGLTMGTPPGKNHHQRALRGDVGGWSAASIRNNTRWLYSVDESALTGSGLAFTLTVQDCPSTAVDWHRIRRALVERLRRMGMIRLHWVTEWQKRGVPHLHGAAYFSEVTADTTQRVLDAWLELTGPYGSRAAAQHVKGISDPVGWFQYVSKHAARGLHHYQRSPEGIPQQWRSKTGRMWGHLGSWPIASSVRLEISQPAFWCFRRIVRAWRTADARQERQRKTRTRRIRSARRMLSCSDRNLSEVRGVSEWLDQDDALMLVHYLAGMGHRIAS